MRKQSFSSLFATEDTFRETSPAAKSEEKRLFSHATNKCVTSLIPAVFDEV